MGIEYDFYSNIVPEFGSTTFGSPYPEGVLKALVVVNPSGHEFRVFL
jgi:hypothetical protein